MTGRLYIDGIDADLAFNTYVVRDGLNSLVAMPPLKAVDYNDWHEEDGIEVDLSAPELDTAEVSINFAMREVLGSDGMQDLIELLSDGAYHTFNFAFIGREYRLRLVSHTSLSLIREFGKATLKFANDFPLDGYTYAAPTSTIQDTSDYYLDGQPLTAWGVNVLQGSLSEVIKAAEVKKNLLRNIGVSSGASYDGAGGVSYKSKDVKLKCLLRAESLPELWRNYDALLYDLVRPGERLLEVSQIAEEFPCYYKSCSVSKFCPTGKIWLEFTLTLVFTRDFRITDEPLLATEDGQCVLTETEDYITLKTNR